MLGLPELLLLVSICGTPSGWGAGDSDCRLEDQSRPQTIVKARLYRTLRWSYGMPVLVDSLPATAGIEVCFAGIDSSIAASYWITSVNGAGMESCLGQGLSFPRVVGVDNPAGAVPESGERYFDLAGRRLPRLPTTPGWYWLKAPGHPARKVLVR